MVALILLEKDKGLLPAAIFGITSPNKMIIAVMSTVRMKRYSSMFCFTTNREKARYNKNAAIPVCNKFLMTIMLASSISGRFTRYTILLSFLFPDSFNSFNFVLLSEKKATSEPEIKKEAISNSRIIAKQISRLPVAPGNNCPKPLFIKIKYASSSPSTKIILYLKL